MLAHLPSIKCAFRRACSNLRVRFLPAGGVWPIVSFDDRGLGHRHCIIRTSGGQGVGRRLLRPRTEAFIGEAVAIAIKGVCMTDRRLVLAGIGAGVALAVTRRRAVRGTAARPCPPIRGKAERARHRRLLAAFRRRLCQSSSQRRGTAAGRGRHGQAGLGWVLCRAAERYARSQVAIEVLVATEDHFAASYVYTGTQQGLLFGVSATGKACASLPATSSAWRAARSPSIGAWAISPAYWRRSRAELVARVAVVTEWI